MAAPLRAALGMLALAALSSAAASDLPTQWAELRASRIADGETAHADASPSIARETPGGDPAATPAEDRATEARIDARKSHLIPAAEIVGFEFLLNEFDRHALGTDYASNISTIRRNLRSSWVVDRDPFQINQLGHPYAGSMYQGFARASGLNYWESLGYTFAGSAL